MKSLEFCYKITKQPRGWALALRGSLSASLKLLSTSAIAHLQQAECDTGASQTLAVIGSTVGSAQNLLCFWKFSSAEEMVLFSRAVEKREHFQHDSLAHQWPEQMINNNNTAALVGRKSSSALAHKCQELTSWEFCVLCGTKSSCSSAAPGCERGERVIRTTPSSFFKA